MSYEIGKALKRKKSGKKISKSEKQLAKSKAKNKNIDLHKLLLKELKNMNWNI
jgi:hypothetical protein